MPLSSHLLVTLEESYDLVKVNQSIQPTQNQGTLHLGLFGLYVRGLVSFILVMIV